jgi:hypothetical protein
MGRAAYEAFTCSCGERCLMVPHERTGTLAPITMTASLDGNIVLNLAWNAIHGNTYRIGPKAERDADPKPRLLNHFANCPDRVRFGGRS